MEIDNATSEKIQELQLLEQNLQSLALQSQAFQLEINETEHALSELKASSDGEVFKITGQIMVKSDKKTLEEELDKKLKLFSLRIKSIEKQETELSSKAEELRNFISSKIDSKKK